MCCRRLAPMLDLLECQAKGVGNIGLTHIENEPAHAQAVADILVDRIKWTSGHRSPHDTSDLSPGTVGRNAMRLCLSRRGAPFSV
jgi:hypothetical protein